jgi:tRNA uridine 5-carboxymethylaminomethyl modification enzyme
VTLATLLRRPELSHADVRALAGRHEPLADGVSFQVEVTIKYGGYVERQNELVARSRHMEDVKLPPDFDYAAIRGLSHEVREKLSVVRPHSLGQAARISGITPAALSLLSIHLRREGIA